MFLNNSYMPQRSSSEQCLATSTPPNVGPSQILPFLYLGSQEDALSTKVMQVKINKLIYLDYDFIFR
jgi:hypothetical protein